VKQIVRDRAPNQATLGRFARNVPAELAGAPLSHTALRVLLAYAAHANGGGYAWPGLRLLAAECALRSPSSAADAIAELVAAGWLVLHRPGAGRHPSVYRVSWLTRGARLGITRGVARSARPHRRSARPRVVVARALGAQNKTIEQEHVEQNHRTPLGPPVHIIPPMARTDVPTWRWA
jgi:helix-turn-helix protein